MDEGPTMEDVNRSAAVPLWEAAEHAGVEVDLVLDLVLAGRIPSIRRPNGRPLVDPLDVLEAMNYVPGTGSPR
jgi:hypothetical protein